MVVPPSARDARKGVQRARAPSPPRRRQNDDEQGRGARQPAFRSDAAPAFAEGFFYVLSDVRSALSKVRAKDGETVAGSGYDLRGPPSFLKSEAYEIASGARPVADHHDDAC